MKVIGDNNKGAAMPLASIAGLLPHPICGLFPMMSPKGLDDLSVDLGQQNASPRDSIPSKAPEEFDAAHARTARVLRREREYGGAR
jgi:hypothetical protein